MVDLNPEAAEAVAAELRGGGACAIAIGVDVTDEAGAIEAAGLQPKLVASSTSNLKVTYPADLALAALILREQASS